MDLEQAQNIFQHHRLENVLSIHKIEIGFTNKVYSINDKYILKICDDRENEGNFEKEVFLYNYFKGKLPVPEVILFDASKEIYGRDFMIYHKIQGENLYSKWHLMSDDQRKAIVQQLCQILKTINTTELDTFLKRYETGEALNWRDRICAKITNSVGEIKKQKILPSDFLQKVEVFVERNKNALDEQMPALVYWDAHFDNILISKNRIVGLLDFERTEYGSIDFVLDIIKRMMDYPKKYMSEEFEKFAKKKDYAKLFIWFQEFYPELFQFQYLQERLAMYSIEHDLHTLIYYPNSNETKQMIANTVHFSSPH